jgi:hypothetical protein
MFHSGVLAMNRSQRIVAFVYCLLVVYCCAWVPWHATAVLVEEDEGAKSKKTTVLDARLGYAWVWSQAGPPIHFEGENIKADDPHFLEVITRDGVRMRQQASETPDMVIIALRLVAATALGAAAFLLAGRWRSPQQYKET